MTAPPDPAVLRRIKALLALGKSPEPAEAAAAIAKAQELLLKYDLDMAAVPGEEDENPLGEEIAAAPTDKRGEPVLWRCQLAAAVANGCLCRAIRYKGPDGWLLAFVGRKRDVDVAKAMAEYLAGEVAARAKAEWRRHKDGAESVADFVIGALLGSRAKPDGKRWREDFCTAAVGALNDRLRKGREAFAGEGAGSRALMVARDAEVDAVVEARFPGVARGSVLSVGDMGAAAAGLLAGRAIPLSRPAGPAADLARKLLGGGGS